MQLEPFSKAEFTSRHVPLPEDARSNEDLLSHIAGKIPAAAVIAHYRTLTDLAHASFEDLDQIAGVGKRKAAAIRSAFLLAERLSREVHDEPLLLDTPERVANLLRERNRLYTVEVFQVALLNTRRRLISALPLTQGTLDTILVHPREVFSIAIQKRAAAIILAHNHPSGDPTPSEADIKVTRNLIRAGQILKIEVLDHIIFGIPTPEKPKGFVSLRELGYFYDYGPATPYRGIVNERPVSNALFPLGQIVATPNALDALTQEDITTALRRHASGDWGDVDEHDRQENDLSLKQGFRLLSVYHAANRTKFWIITEADRSVTTILLPEDY